jgi:hypothetical protein
MAAIANMTAVAAKGLPTLRATPLFNTPMKGMPAPASRDHAAKTKYERIRSCSFLDRGLVARRREDTKTGHCKNQFRPLRVEQATCSPHLHLNVQALRPEGGSARFNVRIVAILLHQLVPTPAKLFS